MAGRSAILTVKIIGDATDATKALADTASASERFQAGLSKAAGVAAVGLAAGAAAAVSFAKAAAEDEQSASTLAQALKNTAGATDQQVAAAEKWIAAQGKALGVADDQLRPALASLATATGDVAKAQDLASLAMDLSAARGVPVQQAADAIAKAYAGQTTALGRLVPGLDEAALKSGDFTQVQQALSQVVGGQAATAANTAAGQYQIFQTQLGEAQESLGAGLLPMLQQFVPYLTQMAQWVQDNADKVKTLVVVVGGLAAAIVAANVGMQAYNAAMAIYQGLQAVISGATKAWTAVQWLLNAALNANPIGLVVAAIGALVAIFVVAYNRSETFRNAVNALGSFLAGVFRNVIHGVGQALQAVGQWLSNVASTVGGAFRSAWQSVTGVINGVVGAIRNVVTWIQNAIAAVRNFFSSGIGRIGSAVGGLFGRSAGVGAAPPVLAGRSAEGRATTGYAGVRSITINNTGYNPQYTAHELQRLLSGARVRTGYAGIRS